MGNIVAFKIKHVILGLTPVFAFVTSASYAQTSGVAPTARSLTANTTTENFDTLAASGTTSNVVPSGFGFAETDTGRNTTYTVGTGSSGTGDTYSFGAAGSSERAFGTLQSGSVLPTLYGAFTNNTGTDFNRLTIGYRGEQWRLGTAGRADRLDFSYAVISSSTALTLTTLANAAYTNVSSLNFASPVTTGAGALNGNATSNGTDVSAAFNTIVAAGDTIVLRWTDFDASGADDGLAVDNFSFSAESAPEPTTAVLSGLGGVILLGRRRKPRMPETPSPVMDSPRTSV